MTSHYTCPVQPGEKMMVDFLLRPNDVSMDSLLLYEVRYGAVGERSAIHKEVFLGLDRLLDKIEKDEKVRESASSTDEEKQTRTRIDLMTPSAQMHTYYEVYEQCLASCNSPIPIRIKAAYNLLKNQMRLAMKEREEGMNYKDQVYFKYAFDALFNNISTSIMWPLYVMNPEKAVNKSYQAAIDVNAISGELAFSRATNKIEVSTKLEAFNAKNEKNMR